MCKYEETHPIEIHHVPNPVEIQTKADQDSSGGGSRSKTKPIERLWLKAEEGGRKVTWWWRMNAEERGERKHLLGFAILNGNECGEKEWTLPRVSASALKFLSKCSPRHQMKNQN
ncbi:hypothetical protein L2E82_44652 [Cichorium intybus]|uniref:Uncharacterized protein n=1 Tax=Cichorium intybus TaxID=13427 RepID=A0ACB8ZS52_CICIN|nr:hypothetical protein L2E82_44652 [Cichorium intybus]